jgi:hypothetical protein
VALGGSLRAASERRAAGEGPRRHPVAMGSLAVMMAAIAALAVVGIAVVDEREEAVVLGQKSSAVHSLHFVNTLHPEEAARALAKDGLDASNRMTASADSIVGSTHDERLASAKLAAQNRLEGAKLPKSVQAESREELKLKQELDASVAAKERNTLAMSSKNMKSILAQAAAAKRAKDLKVHVTKADSSGGDSSEEAALRKQLDDDARKRQANMLLKAEPALKGVRGRQERMSVAASHLARKAGKQLSESALESELRNQLNSKVKDEESSMFKTAVNRWLGTKGKGEGKAAVTAGARGRSANRAHAHQAASGPSSSLVMAETMMKHELKLSKQPARDTTLSHSSLRKARKQSSGRKQRGLAQLEQAMLKSSLTQARKDGPSIHKQHEMMDKLKEAAREKRKRDAATKPSYQTAMSKFTARLMHKEVSARHRFLAHAAQPGRIDKKVLESAIKKRVSPRPACPPPSSPRTPQRGLCWLRRLHLGYRVPHTATRLLCVQPTSCAWCGAVGGSSGGWWTLQVALKLSMANKKLEQERSALLKQFHSGHSLFAKAERKELKELQGQAAPRQLAAPPVKDSWHL